MQPLYPQDLAAFTRRYQWRGARLLGVRWIDTTFTLRLAVRDTQVPMDQPRPRVRLSLHLTDVEEFRLQRRLNTKLSRLTNLRLAYLNGAFLIDLEPYDLGGDRPSLHDFRASSYYVGGRTLTYDVRVSTTAAKREATG